MESDECTDSFKIYPLSQLFFELKNESCKYGLDAEQGFASVHIAQAMLDRDQYDYRQDISCAVRYMLLMFDLGARINWRFCIAVSRGRRCF